MKNYVFFFILFLFLVNIGFSQAPNASFKRYEKLSQKVSNHFKKDPNPLKKKAADFLLRGMFGHVSALPYWTDKNGSKIDLDEFQYDSFEDAKKAFDNAARQGKKQRIAYKKDIDQLEADFLIKTIEHSFEVWQNSGWYQTYSFENFLEYVLPYRSSLEPIEKDWKQKYFEQYQSALFVAANPNDPVSVCSELIKSIKHFEFVAKRDYPQPMLSIDQVHFRGQGNCTDLANTVLLLGRSLGLAVTYDFTPYHAASSNSHYWNTILDGGGNFIPFNGNGELPYTYNALNKRLGKVLRYTFSAQKDALINKVAFEQIPTRKLKEANVIDVTDEYVSTSDVSYTFDTKIKNDIGYITVFNRGNWKALWWSATDAKNTAVFKNMGRDLVYLPSRTRDTLAYNKKYALLQLEEYPILVKNDGTQHLLQPDFKDTFDSTISRTNEKPLQYLDYNTLELYEGTSYNLYYWKGSWKLFGKAKCKNKGLSFKNVPKNALFRITPDDADDFERIFTLNPATSEISWY